MKGEKLLEQELLASFERGEWKPVGNQKGEMERLRAAAKATLLKNKRVNIRISSRDLEGLQAKAAEEGVPYQTLMASVLHKFVSGRLVETQRRITTRSTRTRAKAARAGYRHVSRASACLVYPEQKKLWKASFSCPILMLQRSKLRISRCGWVFL